MRNLLYQVLAHRLEAMQNCQESGNKEWEHKHKEIIEHLLDKYAPSGSGFDSGTRLDWDESHEDKLVFTTEFHHMNENGFYVGWTNHTTTVTPSLIRGFHLRVSGRNVNDIKDHIAETFSSFLETDV